MEKLDFTELHKEKLAVIFENIDILTAMKESDTQLPPRFFREIIDDTVLDYKAKMVILNKNTKFVTRELMKDFKLLRREQRKRQAELRKQRKRETLLYRPCAGGYSITYPPRHTVTLLGVLWTIKSKLTYLLRTKQPTTKETHKPAIGALL